MAVHHRHDARIARQGREQPLDRAGRAIDHARGVVQQGARAFVEGSGHGQDQVLVLGIDRKRGRVGADRPVRRRAEPADARGVDQRVDARAETVVGRGRDDDPAERPGISAFAMASSNETGIPSR